MCAEYHPRSQSRNIVLQGFLPKCQRPPPTIGAERDGTTRKQAEAELRERLVRVERKGYRRPRACEWAETWLEEGKRRRGWKPRTVSAYRNALKHLGETFGPMRLGSIRPRDVSAYREQALGKRFSPATVGLHLTVLHDVFQGALAEELVQSNPVSGVERPRIPKQR